MQRARATRLLLADFSGILGFSAVKVPLAQSPLPLAPSKIKIFDKPRSQLEGRGRDLNPLVFFRSSWSLAAGSPFSVSTSS